VCLSLCFLSPPPVRGFFSFLCAHIIPLSAFISHPDSPLCRLSFFFGRSSFFCFAFRGRPLLHVDGSLVLHSHQASLSSMPFFQCYSVRHLRYFCSAPPFFCALPAHLLSPGTYSRSPDSWSRKGVLSSSRCTETLWLAHILLFLPVFFLVL